MFFSFIVFKGSIYCPALLHWKKEMHYYLKMEQTKAEEVLETVRTEEGGL